MAAVLIAAVGPASVALEPASTDEPDIPVTAPPAPEGSVPGTDEPAPETATSPPVEDPYFESWTPTSHSVTENGETTLELFARPAFKRDADGWSEIDPTIVASSGDYPFEAPGLATPVRFGSSADELVTIETVSGPVVFGLDGASITSPTLDDGVITYPEVFPGVDLEFRTEGGSLGQQFVIADEESQSEFRFTVDDPNHALGEPTEERHEAWEFSHTVAFGTGIELTAPTARSHDDDTVGLPGSAHQQVDVTSDGYVIDISVNELWAQSAQYPLALSPEIVWTDEVWSYGFGLNALYGAIGANDCDGEPCPLTGPTEHGLLWAGLADRGDGMLDYLTYVGTDVGVLADREVTSALLAGYDYSLAPTLSALCSVIGPSDTGLDLASARCAGANRSIPTASTPGYRWSFDVTHIVRAAVRSQGPTNTDVGFAIGRQEVTGWSPREYLEPPILRLEYGGYPVPRPLRFGQTLGCGWGMSTSTSNQALAADPVNTATGGLVECFGDMSVAGVGEPIALTRTYNSLDESSGPLGTGWSFEYGARLIDEGGGEFTFIDGTGTQSRYAALVGGGYAPIDPAVSTTLSDGPNDTYVLRNLEGDTKTFDSDGVLIAAADRRGQGVTLSYAGDKLTTVTDDLGQTLTFGWDAGVGDEARIVSATTSDGRVVGFGHTVVAGEKRLTSVTAVDGAITTYDYVTGGWLSGITDPLGNISARSTFDAQGRIISQLDETGAMTTFDYDDANQTTTITDPTGEVRIDVYNGYNLVRQIDGNGAVTEQLHDGNNNHAAVVDAADRLFRNDYDERDRLVRRVASAPLHYTETWTYDNDDRVTSYTDADGFTTTYTYNTEGLVTTIDHPDGGTETFTYTTDTDPVPTNLLATSTDPLGRTTTYSYSAAGDLTAVTSPEGRTTTSTYDAAHRLISTTSPEGGTTSYTYDDAGRVLTVTDPTGATTTNTYDVGGRLTKTTDALGRPTRFFYDEAGRLIRTRDAMGNVSRTRYDEAGRVRATIDAEGERTRFFYDDAGHLIRTRDALGRDTHMTYDDLGQLLDVTDPAGGVTSYTYDAIGRTTSVTDADGITETYTYNGRGQVTSVTDALGGYQSTFYDSMGRPDYVSDSDWVWSEHSYDLAGQLIETITPRSTNDYIPDYWEDRTTFEYDDDGLQVAVTDPRGNVPGADPEDFTTTVEYDDDGRPVSATDPLGRVVTTTYDEVGRPVTSTNPTGHVTRYRYNDVGWLTSVRAPGQGATRYRYDRVGNLTKRIDALDRETLYTYDGVGRLTSQTDPLGRVTSMAYDAVGNLIEVVKPSGAVTPADGTIEYVYDDADRLLETTFSDGTADLTYDYSPGGRLESATRILDNVAVSSSTYTYDDAGRVATASHTGPGASLANYAYTSTGRLSGAAWSTGAEASYNYNSLGQLTRVTATGVPGVTTVDYGYDPAGLTTSVTRNGGPSPIVSTMTYDNAGQLTTLAHEANSTVLESHELTRDMRGNPTRVESVIDAVPSLTLYRFDAADRVRSECYSANGVGCTGLSERSVYTYDTIGNRLTEATRTVTGSQATEVTTEYVYDAADQLINETVDNVTTATHTWTVNGTLASTTTQDGTRTFVSDLADELVSLTLEDDTVVTYTHDVAGNRTSRSIDDILDTQWAWDDLAALPVRIGEFDAADNLTTTWLPDVFSPTGAPLTETASGTTSWLLTDPFQHVTGAVDVAGATLTGTRDLSVFGTQRSTATGSLTSSPFGFHGQYLDDATGLYDMRARNYQPGTGRFTTQDPISVPTGMPYFATYLYAHNNPLRFIDPIGLFASSYDSYDPTGKSAEFETVTTEGPLYSYSWGQGRTTSTRHVLIPDPDICLTDVAVGVSDRQSQINEYCAEELRQDHIASLKELGGCYAIMAWYGDNTAAITSAFAFAGAVLGVRSGLQTAKTTPANAANTVSNFGNLTHASAGIAPYRTQSALTAGKGGSIQAHHLIEKRFADVMGGNTRDWASIVVTRSEHQVFTNQWRQAIPYGSRNVTPNMVNNAARNIYRDYPEILRALGLG